MTKSFISSLVLAFSVVLFAAAVPVLAIGPVVSGMAGVETSLVPTGMPLNPAAATRFESNAIAVGLGVPDTAGLPMFVVMHQPAERMASTLSGTLGAKRVTTNYIDATSGLTVQRVSDEVVYQVAQPYASGAFGIGMRWLSETDGGTKLTGKAWRIDAGWQQRIWQGLIAGVVAHDVLGSNFKYSNGTETAKAITWRGGLSYQAGQVLAIGADAWDFKRYIPGHWAVGLEVTPFRFLQLRAGYQSAPTGDKYTVGGGLQLGAWRVDGGATMGKAPQGVVGVTLQF